MTTICGITKDLHQKFDQYFLEEMVRELKNGQLKGHYNANIFGSWQNKNLQFLLNDPQKFLQSFPINPNRFEKSKILL